VLFQRPAVDLKIDRASRDGSVILHRSRGISGEGRWRRPVDMALVSEPNKGGKTTNLCPEDTTITPDELIRGARTRAGTIRAKRG
jgi:hypothetical protein